MLRNNRSLKELYMQRSRYLPLSQFRWFYILLFHECPKNIEGRCVFVPVNFLMHLCDFTILRQMELVILAEFFQGAKCSFFYEQRCESLLRHRGFNEAFVEVRLILTKDLSIE